jgi:hypothetical protein
MRVATIFTGVTACTFGAATQVANAQDAAHTAAAHTAARAGLAMPAGGASYGSIRMNSACANRGIDAHWLHVSAYDGLGAPYPQYQSNCYGYFGLYNSPPGVGIVAQCGGNNHGLLVGTTAAGHKWSAGFGPGTTWRKLNEAHLNGIFINSWTGNDACGKGPYWYE